MLQKRNFRKLLVAALLVGAAGVAFAGEPCGTNLEYEIDGTVLRLTSPDPSISATIDAQAFRNRTDFTEVIIPDNVTEINTKAFEGCTALTSVVIPPAVTLIGVEAFHDCSLLVSVLCRPYPAPELGTDGFTGCAAGLTICVPALGAYKYETNWTTYEDNLSVCFLDENDEQSVVAGQISTLRTLALTDIDIFRTLRKAGCFNTMTLPFNVPNIETSPLAGAEVYEFVGATVLDSELQLDITPLAGSALVAGTPYLIQWPNTGEVLKRMHFTGITWDTDQTADDAGSGDVTFHGFYGKTHISDNIDGEDHLHLFLGANNQLYWPLDGDDASAKMLGFRAWFEINNSGALHAPIYHGMPASLHIVSASTGVENAADEEAVVVRKEMRDGQLVIIRNGQTFSVNGQRL